ncbi:hypothetical protein FOZ63_018846, partial [Perkinsus olseni]
TDPHCFVSSPSESLSSGIVGVTEKGSVDEAQPTSSEDENDDGRMTLLANPLGAYPRSLPPPKSSPDRSVVSLPAPSPCDAQPPRRSSGAFEIPRMTGYNSVGRSSVGSVASSSSRYSVNLSTRSLLMVTSPNTSGQLPSYSMIQPRV